MAGMVTILDKRGPRHPEKVNRPDTPVLRKPDWIRVRVPAAGGRLGETRRILRAHGLVTVCEEAACPNIGGVLGAEPRHHDDHGRHLHARLRLLQRGDGAAGAARSEGAG